METNSIRKRGFPDYMEVQELLIHPAPPKSLNDVNKDKDTIIHFFM